MVELGDRLQKEGMVAEAHMAFLLAGLQPGASHEAIVRGLHLIGVDSRDPDNALLRQEEQAAEPGTGTQERGTD